MKNKDSISDINEMIEKQKEAIKTQRETKKRMIQNPKYAFMKTFVTTHNDKKIRELEQNLLKLKLIKKNENEK